MIKFEIPYNLDPAYPEKLLQRPALIPYIDCIYAAAWKDDCDNTRFDITFRSDYPKTYEEYVERIKSPRHPCLHTRPEEDNHHHDPKIPRPWHPPVYSE